MAGVQEQGELQTGDRQIQLFLKDLACSETTQGLLSVLINGRLSLPQRHHIPLPTSWKQDPKAAHGIGAGSVMVRL